MLLRRQGPRGPDRANVSDKPTEAVAEHFDKGHTAALYIKRARERGFLGPAIKGKAGEQR
jgi:hypothetical protein